MIQQKRLVKLLATCMHDETDETGGGFNKMCITPYYWDKYT